MCRICEGEILITNGASSFFSAVEIADIAIVSTVIEDLFFLRFRASFYFAALPVYGKKEIELISPFLIVTGPLKVHSETSCECS